MFKAGIDYKTSPSAKHRKLRAWYTVTATHQDMAIHLTSGPYSKEKYYILEHYFKNDPFRDY